MNEWNHLSELVLFALAMQETLKEVNRHSAKNFQLRVGKWLSRRALTNAHKNKGWCVFPTTYEDFWRSIFLSKRHCSWAGGGRCDRCHQAAVWHLGLNSKLGQPHGQHRCERTHPGARGHTQNPGRVGFCVGAARRDLCQGGECLKRGDWVLFAHIGEWGIISRVPQHLPNTDFTLFSSGV